MPRHKAVEKRKPNEERCRAALDGLKNQAGAGELLTGLPAPASSSLLYPPVSELANERGLQPRAQSGYPGSIPGWGTFTPNRNLVHNKLR